MPTAAERTSGPSALSIRDLSKSFGDRRALDGVSLAALRRERSSGFSAPTAPARRPSSAPSLAASAPTPARSDPRTFAVRRRGRARRGGWVPQEIALYPLLSPRENLWTFGRYQGLAGGALQTADPREPASGSAWPTAPTTRPTGSRAE